MHPAFTILPADYCAEPELPTIPVTQDCTNYEQPLSQIFGLLILPNGTTPPVDWTTIEGWSAIIDNEDPAKAHYFVGIGSFIPESKTVVRLADGRFEFITDRRWRLDFDVLNIAPGHIEFSKQLESGYRGFTVWLQTLGKRLIGGPYGMAPFVVDSGRPFEKSNTSTERIEIVLDFFFSALPG